MIKTIPPKNSLCHVDDEKHMKDTTKMKIFDYIECTEVGSPCRLSDRENICEARDSSCWMIWGQFDQNLSS
jgi:hypothetical protein